MNPNIIYEISEKCDFYTKIKIKRLNCYIYSLVRITELPNELEKHVTDDNIKNLSQLIKLDLWYNHNITVDDLRS